MALAAEIIAAIDALRRGELVGLPTETVYGLAADAAQPDAVAKIFALKGRPIGHPLIVHLAESAHLDAVATAIPEAARRLAAAFWPGPLTLILRRAPGLTALISGGAETVGVRVPAHPIAQAVLQAFPKGLAAPSANRFGRISPTSAAHVRAEFGLALPIVLDGGSCAIGIESTIVDCTGATPRLLRPGRLGIDAIEAELGFVLDNDQGRGRPRVSGDLASHYAPHTPTELHSLESLRVRSELYRRAGKRVARLLMSAKPMAGPFTRCLPCDPAGYAQGLYAALRELDALAADYILIEAPPVSLDYLAIWDRLRKASTPP